MNKLVILMILVICFYDCNKTDDNIDPNLKASFTAKINDKSITFKESDLDNIDPNGIFWNPSETKLFGSLKDTTIFVISLSIGKLVVNLDSIKELFEIQLICPISDKDITNNDLSESQFLKVLMTGKRNYSYSQNMPGIRIKYNDSEGILWETCDITYNKDKCVNTKYDDFKIVKSIKTSISNKHYKYSQYLEIYFDCLLYNSKGDSLKLTNGNLKCIFRSFKDIK